VPADRLSPVLEFFDSAVVILLIKIYFTSIRPFCGELLIFEIFDFFLFSKNSIFFYTRASRQAVTNFGIFQFVCRNFIDQNLFHPAPPILRRVIDF
jgi:hypothetical protein